MDIETDDLIYRVDRHWLGPEGFTLPFRSTFADWGVGIVAFLGVLWVARSIGVGIGFFPLAWILVITVLIVKGVRRLTSGEVTLSQMALLVIAEISGPRPPRAPRRRRGGDE